MYISHEHRCGFIHIPKTGGTAIRYLLNHLGTVRIGQRHSTLAQTPDVPEDYRLFTIVRDPYDRLISMYRFQFISQWRNQAKHIKRWGSNDIRKTRLKNFATFVKSGAVDNMPLSQLDYIGPEVKIFKYEEDAHNQIVDWLGLDKKVLLDENTHYFGEYSKREWSDPEGISIISRHCARDFESFGYSRKTWKQLDG